MLCGGHHTAALTSRGTVYTWGFDDDGRLGHGSPGHQFTPKVIQSLSSVQVVHIACGCWHSAALTSAGAVYTWGSCKSGQLGQALSSVDASLELKLPVAEAGQPIAVALFVDTAAGRWRRAR